MAAFTLDQATAKLAEWTAAETAIAAGQSYSIAGRALVRANLREIGERITYWAGMVDRLSRSPVGARVRRVVPFN
jgi:Family of unknown function (DUF6148)